MNRFPASALISTSLSLFLLASASPAAPAPGGGLSILEEGKLLASDGQAEDRFGESVAMDGDTAVIGAYLDDDKGNGAGSAYVFVYTGTTWFEQAKLLASDGQASYKFGLAVAVSGDTAVVGAPWENGQIGAAYVYVRNAGVWTQQAKVFPADGGVVDWFGSSVAVHDQTLVVGSPGHNIGGGSGAAYIYTRNPVTLTWDLQQKLVAADVGDSFGYGVALQQDTVLVGDPADLAPGGGGNSGSAYVFTRTGVLWTQEDKLVAADASCCEYFGLSVSLDGSTSLVGAHLDNDAGYQSGSAYIFVRDVGGWVEQAKLKPAGHALGDLFGYRVSLCGDVAMVGAYGDDPFGAAYFFERSGTVWTEEVRVDPGTSTSYYANAVAISDGLAMVTAKEDHELAFRAGSVLTYSVSAAITGPVAYCTAGSSASGCQASLSGIGTPSASAASGFNLDAASVEGSKDGLYFFGTSGRQANPWGNGSSFQCVTPPMKRTGIQLGAGTPGACDGSFSQDLNALWCPTCPKPGKNPGAGTVVQAQLWYRDPQNTSNQTTSLSDALEFTVSP